MKAGVTVKPILKIGIAMPKTKGEWQQALANGCALELAGVSKDYVTVRNTVLRYLKLADRLQLK